MKIRFTLLTLTLIGLLPLSGYGAGYKEMAVTNGGTITGKVTFSGKDPAPIPYKVYKEHDVCGEKPKVFDFVRVNNGALQDAVVYLHRVKAGKPFPPEVGNGRLVQKRCDFMPYLSVMRNNADLVVVNDDPVEHNVHAYELMGRAMKTAFKEDQYKQTESTLKIKLKKGAAMKIECDAHDFMHSFIFVASNPYFAVVKEDGSFEIKDVPPGSYSIRAWHGKLKTLKSKVEVTAGGGSAVNFEFVGK